jgi:predicted ATPase
MISLIEALNYRCLRYVRQEMRPFQILVGPNASGKTTLMDVLGFLHDLVADGLDEAIAARSANFHDLVWQHGDTGFELAVEALISESNREQLEDTSFDRVRYEVRIGSNQDANEVRIEKERAFLKGAVPSTHDPSAMRGATRSLFATDVSIPRGARLFEKTVPNGDVYHVAGRDSEGGEHLSFRFGPRKSTLANLPEDEVQFPEATRFKQLLQEGVVPYELEGRRLRAASAPGQSRHLRKDGANLPWSIANIERQAPKRLQEWIAHLRTALPDLCSISTVERPEDRHRYLRLHYRDGLVVPSWMTSDGTLRLLALTLPAYLDNFNGVYLIEEPENGLHPLAIESMYQSLSSVYEGQVLLATHSPMLVAVADPSEVICFTKDGEGATHVTRGSEHPRLSHWHGEVDLGTLFASGVLE